MRSTRWILLLALAPAPSATTVEPSETLRWGAGGHEMAARAALSVLPGEVPAFFRAASDQLVYLNPEPDRWRVRDRPEMRGAWAPDHFINFEEVADGALSASDRYEYLAALRDAGVERPDQIGFLPFTILERYQRLVTEWELWRRETDPERREWIEARIVNDAGVLGHFVTDGSQPHHTTVHYNGWARERPNPAGYTLDRTFHSRFETAFVDAHVEPVDVSRRVGPARSVAGTARGAVTEYLRTTHSLVEELYSLDRDIGFDPDSPARRDAVDFTAEQLARGAQMLAALWLSAWEESAG